MHDCHRILTKDYGCYAGKEKKHFLIVVVAVVFDVVFSVRVK